MPCYQGVLELVDLPDIINTSNYEFCESNKTHNINVSVIPEPKYRLVINSLLYPQPYGNFKREDYALIAATPNYGFVLDGGHIYPVIEEVLTNDAIECIYEKMSAHVSEHYATNLDRDSSHNATKVITKDISQRLQIELVKSHLFQKDNKHLNKVISEKDKLIDELQKKVTDLEKEKGQAAKKKK
jgi:hypothetical protein